MEINTIPSYLSRLTICLAPNIYFPLSLPQPHRVSYPPPPPPAECRWRGCTALLSLQHETGLTLRSPASGGRGLVLWRHSFDKLTDTWDDDNTVVRLTFSGRETVVSGRRKTPGTG